MKNWTDFFIKHPVISISINLLLVIFGILAYSQLQVRLYPKLESSIIHIHVEYPGASASTMKNFVARRIVDALSNLKSLDYLNASSSLGELNISVHLKIGKSAKSAMNEILANMMSLRSDFPEGVHEPEISIQDSNENPDYLLAFTEAHQNNEILSDYLTRIIRPQFEVLSGVSSIQVLGPQPALKIALNMDAMAAYGLETKDVLSALQEQNRLSSSGFTEGKNSQQTIIVNTEMSSSQELNKIILKNNGEKQVNLSNVAQLSWGSETNKIKTFYNGKPAILLSGKIRSHSNTLKVISLLEKKFESVKEVLPSAIKVHELVNGGNYLKAVLHEMLRTLIITLLIVIILSFLFFKNIRSALIISLSIPISLLGLGIILWAFGASINLLSLLAMIVVMGLLVDDAIVVLENIIRHQAMGHSLLESTYRALREIAMPVIVMSLTLASLFFPVAFLGGLTGGLFFDFALTLVSSVIISGLVSLTLLPMISSKFLHAYKLSPPSKLNRIFAKIQKKYLELVKLFFSHKTLLLSLSFMCAFLGIYSYRTVPSNFGPKEDSRFLEIIAQAPNSSNTHLLLANAKDLSEIYRKIADIKSYSMILGIPSWHQILSFIRLNSSDRNSSEIRNALQSEINQNPNLNAVAIVPSLMPGTQGMPLEFVIQSLGNYRELDTLSAKIIQEARKSGLFLFLNRDLQYDQPVLEGHIHRRIAAAMGVSLASIESGISTLLGENSAQYISHDGELYPLIVQANANLIKNPDFADSVFVKGRAGKLIPLSNLMKFEATVHPAELNQFQKFNSVTISGVMEPPYSLSQGIKFFKNLAKQGLPSSASYDFSGNARAFIQEGHRMFGFFAAAFLLIFILLSMQFENFIDPLIILLGSIPVALFGAMIPFVLGFATLNIYSQIGLLVLCGLVSKHGILITQFANELCKKGYAKKEAVLQAISIRFRPIMMTSLAMILGSLPLLISKGAGFEARFSVGLVIVSGMIVGTFFSLFILPVLYDCFHLEAQEEG